jgi:hypothetical protein
LKKTPATLEMTYRIIYSLQIELEPGPGGQLRELIVPLLPDGTATNIEIAWPKRRAIDLRDGDSFVFQGRRERAVHIQAFRDNYCEAPPVSRRDGFVVRLS